jgi:hypothetical protein
VKEVESDDRWFSVSLRIYGDGLDLDSVESHLGLAPSRVCRKGEHINGNPRYARYRTNLWSWRPSGSHDEPWEPKLIRLLEEIEPKADWLHHVRATGASIDVFLGYCSETGQGGASLSPAVLARLGALALPIELDLYPPGPEPQ